MIFLQSSILAPVMQICTNVMCRLNHGRLLIHINVKWSSVVMTLHTSTPHLFLRTRTPKNWLPHWEHANRTKNLKNNMLQYITVRLAKDSRMNWYSVPLPHHKSTTFPSKNLQLSQNSHSKSDNFQWQLVKAGPVNMCLYHSEDSAGRNMFGIPYKVLGDLPSL